METIYMSQQEFDQIVIFEALKGKSMKQKRAVQLLGLSPRQVKRKLKLYRCHGVRALTHGLRGRSSNHQLDPAVIGQAIALVKRHYPDFGPTLASEKLVERHGLKVNRESLRQAMIGAGLWTVNTRKPQHRAWRPRRACLGELVLLDGSDHDWLEGRGPRLTLLALIDDASSELLGLKFVESESTQSVMQAMEGYLKSYGRPVELYVDRGKVFKVNQHNPDDDKLTQFGRAMAELSIGLVFALTPQAKGRIERLFATLQDRLVKELRLAGVSTIEEANHFAQTSYLPIHNAKYATQPAEPTNLHRSLTGFNLDDILCLKDERVLTNDFTLRYHDHWFQLDRCQKTILFPKDRITTIEHFNGSHELMIRSIKLNFHAIPKPIVQPKPLPIQQPRCVHQSWKPSNNHPWRQYQPLTAKGDISTLQKGDISTLI